MSKSDAFEIVASLPSLDGKPERKIGKSIDGTQFAVLHQVVGNWEFKAGPWTFDTWARCAERVVCGDAAALTWPDAQMCLAAGALVFLSGLNGSDKKELGPDKKASTGGTNDTATVEGMLPASAGMPSSPMPAAPIQDQCRIGGCGD